MSATAAPNTDQPPAKRQRLEVSPLELQAEQLSIIPHPIMQHHNITTIQLTSTNSISKASKKRVTSLFIFTDVFIKQKHIFDVYKIFFLFMFVTPMSHHIPRVTHLTRLIGLQSCRLRYGSISPSLTLENGVSAENKRNSLKILHALRKIP